MQVPSPRPRRADLSEEQRAALNQATYFNGESAEAVYERARVQEEAEMEQVVENHERAWSERAQRRSETP
jgi:hypothetical protein